jgi:hypothetical protein
MMPGADWLGSEGPLSGADRKTFAKRRETGKE